MTSQWQLGILARLGLGIAGGVLLFLAFPPVAVPWAVVPGVACLALAAWQARIWPALASGFVAGLAFFLPLMHWMTVIGTDAWIALGAFCAVWFALMAGAMAAVTRLAFAPVWIACAWVLQEALRGRVPWGGFPWGDLAFSSPGSPWAASLAWLGTAGLGFALALVGAAVAWAVVTLRTGQRQYAWVWPVVAAAFLALTSLVPIPSGAPVGENVVAVVQGGTPQLGMGAMDVRRAVLDNHVKQTIDLASAVARGTAAQPDLVVWPENSSDLDPLTDRSAADAITAAAKAINAPILVGAVVDAEDPAGRDGVWNVGLLWTPAGLPEQMYVKNHPVPFGEFIPFREQVASLIGRFDRVPRDFLAGERPGIFTLGSATFGDVICFEVAYADVIDAIVDGGAEFITVQTNNATYGGTSQPEQQLQITRARAIEQGRFTAVAATTGVSAFIDASGTFVSSMPQGETGWLVEKIPQYDSRTPANIAGHLLELVLCALAIVALGWLAVRRVRKSSPSLGE